MREDREIQQYATERNRHVQRSSSDWGLAFFTIVVGLIFIAGPIAAGSWVSGLSRTILVAFGVGMLTIGAIVVVYNRLYRKTSASEAFVKTGMGGTKTIIDGGALVIPVVHNVTPVSLETIKLEVERIGPQSLICGDRLRADISARFYIKVEKKADDIVAASTSLGELTLHPHELLSRIGEKLESALRDVAATRTLFDLNSKRDEFAAVVQKIVEKELKPNGLTLETVAITHLDQTDPKHLRPNDNVFDAEGAQTMAEITQTARIARNEIERNADKTVAEQDVSRDQFIFQKKVDRATAEANANAETQKAQAKAVQEAAVFSADQERQSGMARAEAQKAVQVAEVERQKAADVAEQQRQQAVKVAAVEQAKAAEIADRQRQIAIAEAEQKRAKAEAEQLLVQQAREAAAQEVQTVQAKAKAERERAVAVIGREAEARQLEIQQNMQADISAYAAVKAAEGEQSAAEKKASARLKLATAEKDANALEAEGQRSVSMVPVDVDRKRVEVEEARVAVERKSLEQQQDFERAAIDLKVNLARIEAEKQARIAVAEAMGEAMAKANMTIWGDPETFTRMSGAFLNGQQNGNFITGLASSTPTNVQELALGVVAGLGALIKKVSGVDVSPETIAQALKPEDAAAEKHPTP